MSQTLLSLIVFVIVATITPGGATALSARQGLLHPLGKDLEEPPALGALAISKQNISAIIQVIQSRAQSHSNSHA